MVIPITKITILFPLIYFRSTIHCKHHSWRSKTLGLTYKYFIGKELDAGEWPTHSSEGKAIKSSLQESCVWNYKCSISARFSVKRKKILSTLPHFSRHWKNIPSKMLRNTIAHSWNHNVCSLWWKPMPCLLEATQSVTFSCLCPSHFSITGKGTNKFTQGHYSVQPQCMFWCSIWCPGHAPERHSCHHQ